MLDAIGGMNVPSFNYGCYTADGARKDRMTDYIFCIDAWRAGASAPQAAAEVSKHGASRVNWDEVCADLWRVLGAHTERKLLLIARILHRERWWVKALIWDDDPGGVRMRDQYLGDMSANPELSDDYGNPGFRDPFSAEFATPDVMAIEKGLSWLCPDWPAFRVAIHSTWLCGPKAFRYLEKLLWCVGKEKMVISIPDYPVKSDEHVPDFLQCADTYPNKDDAKRWMRSFCGGIDAWLRGEEPADNIALDIHKRLGEKNDRKAWLCGLYEKKIRMLNPYGCRDIK